MPDSAELRDQVRERLSLLIARVNMALQGKDLTELEPVLKRLGKGGDLPHWYEELQAHGTLPNLDGKTIGSVLEMLFLATIEVGVTAPLGVPPLRINPARGVDFPDLGLGVKSPSKNFCTSEPFFSAYERLLGSEYDVVVLLTDYQERKKVPPLRLQVIEWEYLEKTTIADVTQCELARLSRDWLLEQDEAWAKKVVRFLAYVNKSDWRAKHLIGLVRLVQNADAVRAYVGKIEDDFAKVNSQRLKKGSLAIPDEDLQALLRIAKVDPICLGIVDAVDNWVMDTLMDAGRPPNENEWQRFLASPLNGRIGMSFALQWRYNFSRVFSGAAIEKAGGEVIADDAEDEAE